MTAADFARALGGRRSGSCWMARCPAHQDRTPSLSITERGGKLLVYCHAGCSQSAVIEALRARGLWPQPERPPGRRSGSRRERPPRVVEASYVYENEQGQPLYRVLRYRPKAFSQEHWDGRGWRTGAPHHMRKVPFRLPQVLKNTYVVVTEGEKDALAMAERGFCGTCNSGGAGKWAGQFKRWNWVPYLVGKIVLIVPDNDPVGRRHAFDVARTLDGLARAIGVITPPPPAKDATDAFELGLWSDAYFCSLIEKVLESEQQEKPHGHGISSGWTAA